MLPENAVLPKSQLEQYAKALEESGEFRVLRRLDPRSIQLQPFPFEAISEPQIQCLLIDFETTGFDIETDDIIEMGAIPFTVSESGHITSVGQWISWFNEPSKPIPEAITNLTGITDEMVAGHRIDPNAVELLLKDVTLVIAHVAKFDRPFAEKLHPRFCEIDWGCSQSQVPWRDRGHDSTKLTNLALAAGYFFGAHRALDDCGAGVLLLSLPLPDTDQPAMKYLLAASRSDTVRIWALGSPFEKKDVLKSRQYLWSDGTTGQPKTWWKEIPASEEKAELEFLATSVFGRHADVPRKRITSRDRFTRRG